MDYLYTLPYTNSNSHVLELVVNLLHYYNAESSPVNLCRRQTSITSHKGDQNFEGVKHTDLNF